MNRSSKGFGLAGVFATVLFLVVLAAVSAPASSQPVLDANASNNSQLATK